MPKPSDKKCKIIFIILLTKGELRFKDLKKELKNKHADMPEPTLLMHLNHLLKQKLIVKTVKSPKNVTYRPNMNKLEEFQKRLYAVQYREWRKMEEAFLNKPIEEQIEIVKLHALTRGLLCLKYQILFEKYGGFEDALMSELADWLFSYQDSLIIKKCLKDEKYMEKLLECLEEELKRIF